MQRSRESRETPVQYSGFSCVAEVFANGAVVITGAIAISLHLMEIDLVEDDAGDAIHLRPQNLESLGNGGAPCVAPLNNQQNLVGNSREGESIDDRQQWRCVHHN